MQPTILKTSMYLAYYYDGKCIFLLGNLLPIFMDDISCMSCMEENINWAKRISSIYYNYKFSINFFLIQKIIDPGDSLEKEVSK